MFFDFISFLIGKCIFFCASIGGDCFPRPLSKEEETILIAAFRDGDMQARDKLISHNLRLVAHVAKKYQGSYDMDDLISVGTIGLIKAVNTFKEGKGTQLATYTARCVENEILMLLRADKKHRNTASLSDVVGTDKDGNELTLMDLLAVDDDSVFTKVEQKVKSGKFKEIVISLLNEKEYKVISLRYGLESGVSLCQREVASLMRISRSYISRIEKKAIEKLRKGIKKDEYFVE